MDTNDSREWPVALQQMESKMLVRDPAPPRKEFDAEGMEKMLAWDERSAGFCGGGMAGLKYAGAWAEESPEEMFSWLVGQERARSFYAYLLFQSWAARDMEAALSAVFKIPDSKLRAQALISSLEVLSKSDPDRARDLLIKHLGLYPPEGDTLVFHGSNAGNKDFLHLISSLPSGAERTHLLAGLLHSMSGSRDAVDFWKGLPESGRRDVVLAGFAPINFVAESFEGLDKIMRQRAESTGDPEATKMFIDCHGDAWARRDLAGVLNWAQTHLKGKARAECREELFQTVIKENFDEAIRVWKTLPDGHVKADVAEAMLRVVRNDDPRWAEAEAVLKTRKQE